MKSRNPRLSYLGKNLPSEVKKINQFIKGIKKPTARSKALIKKSLIKAQGTISWAIVNSPDNIGKVYFSYYKPNLKLYKSTAKMLGLIYRIKPPTTFVALGDPYSLYLFHRITTHLTSYLRSYKAKLLKEYHRKLKLARYHKKRGRKVIVKSNYPRISATIHSIRDELSQTLLHLLDSDLKATIKKGFNKEMNKVILKRKYLTGWKRKL